MNTKVFRPFVYFSLFVLIVGLACNAPTVPSGNTEALPTQTLTAALLETSAEIQPAAQAESGVEVLQESTDNHWIIMVRPIKNTNSTCDLPATLGEWHGCDKEVEQKLLDLYKDQPGAGIVYVNSYAEASSFLISRGWDPNAEIRGFHLEEFRLDELHDGEGRSTISDLALLPMAADHDGGFLMTWDVNTSLFKYNPRSMTPVP